MINVNNKISPGYELTHPASNGIVLLYHRINSLENDPWHLAVSPELFEAQLTELSRECALLPLSKLGSTANKKTKLPVYITFDDGYLDNLEIAKPILERQETPATFFITTNAIDAEQEFWWDALENIVFNSSPHALVEMLDTSLFRPSLKEKIRFGLLGSVLGKSWIGKKQRIRIYFHIWERIYKLNSALKSTTMEALHNIAQLPTKQRETHRTMTTDDVYALSDSSLINVAAHGVTHDALGEFDNATALDEIKKSHNYLSRFSNNINTFSYPHGSVPNNAKETFFELGIDYAFTTQPGRIDGDVLALEIPRLTVDKWSPDILITRIKMLLHYA